MKTISYSRQNISQEDINAVCSVLRSDWLTQGSKVREFEDALCHQTGAKHCVVVCNGTVALHLSCLALGLGPGQVGLTSPISFMASANCIAYCGGTPDFADIDPKTLCLSPEKVEEYCKTGRIPKVVIPVCFAGVPAELPCLKRLSAQYGFQLIEDAAHAIGSNYKFEGKKYNCGSCAHTDMAIFSFHPVKTITTGEGGAILTNDDDLASKLRLLANHGVQRDPSHFTNKEFASALGPPTSNHYTWYHEMQILGYNGRLTDIQCALGLSQLKRLNEFKVRRQEIVREYNEAFKDLEKKQLVTLPPWPENTDPCYHIYTLRVGPACAISRDELLIKLREKGISCQVHYIPIYRQPFYRKRFDYPTEHFPEAEEFFFRCLSLPFYPEMDEETIHYVIGSVETLLSSGGSRVL